MAYVPNSGSVAAWLQSDTASVITVGQSSVAAVIIGGSIAASFTPPANQSVSGTVNTAQTGTVITSLVGVTAFPSSDNAAIQNNLPVAAFPVVFNGTNWDRLRGNSSVGALVSTAATSVITVGQGSIATVIVGGSIAASFTPPANQSVSGTVNVAEQGTWAVSIAGILENTIQASTTGVPVMFKSNMSSSIVSVVSPAAPLPVSVQGVVTALQGTTPWLIGSVYGNVSGSVVAFQGTTPWAVSAGGSVITVSQSSSLIGVVTGSVVAITNNASVITVNQSSSIITKSADSSVIAVPVGSVITVLQTGSLLAVQSGTNITSIAGILENTIQTSTAGVPILFRGNTNTSILSIVSSLTPLPISGASFSLSSVVVVAGSIITVPTGSVISIFQSSSLISVNAGSVVTISQGSVITVSQSSSIIAVVTGSVASAGAQATSVYGMRSDALSSFLGVDKTIRPIVTDDAGRTLTKPFAGEQASIISYVGSTVSGSVQLIAASIAGQRAYITDFWLSNTGATTTLVTFQDGTTSIMGQFIAPAGGGMASPGLDIPLKSVSSVASDVAFKVSPSTSILYVVVKGYYAP